MARATKKIHYIYKTTCNVTNRYYIGMHSTNDLGDGYMGSGKRLRYSIRKYGKDNHNIEILEFCDTREELKKREEEIVNSDLVNEANCMNLVIGGGGFMLDDYHYKCSKAGGEAFTEKLRNDLEYFRIHSDRSSKAMKKVHAMGKVPYDNFKGKKHSDETKKKISEANKGKGTGKTNSQYGTCWITRDGKNKKIKKEELDQYIKDGWVKGRK